MPRIGVSLAAVFLLLAASSRVAVADRAKEPYDSGLLDDENDTSDISEASTDPSETDTSNAFDGEASTDPSDTDTNTDDDVEASVEDGGSLVVPTDEAPDGATADGLEDDGAADVSAADGEDGGLSERSNVPPTEDDGPDRRNVDALESVDDGAADASSTQSTSADNVAEADAASDGEEGAEATGPPPPPLDVHTAGMLAANADKTAAAAVADAKGWTGIATEVKAKAVDKLNRAKDSHLERLQARRAHAKALADKENQEMQDISGDLAKLGVH